MIEMKIFKILGSTVLATAISVTSIHSAQATTQSSSSTSNQSNQNVLFDNSHEQTAGAADWVIDGAFSDYADSIKQQGYNVKELDGEANISDSTLKNTHILVIPKRIIHLKKKNNKPSSILLNVEVVSFSSQTITMLIEI